MSSRGVNAINSAPLIIRTYLDTTINNTYVLGQYDNPIPNDYVLTVSSNGLLVPTNDLILSTINISTIYASTVDVQTINTSSIFTSTVDTQTINTSSINTSTINSSSTFTNYISMVSGEIVGISTINNLPYPPTGDDSFWTGSITGDVHNDNTGNIGIGTTVPQAKLDVSGSAIFSDTRTTGDAIVYINGYSPFTDVPGLTVQNGSGQVSLFGSLNQGNYNPMVQVYDSGIIFESTINNGNLVIAPHNLTIPSGLRISSSGYTTNYGSFSVFSSIISTTVNNLANVGGITFIPDGDGSGNELRYGGAGQNASIFRIVGPGDAEHMRIEGFGSNTIVGINTSTPIRTLDVNGDINTSGALYISSNGSNAALRMVTSGNENSYIQSGSTLNGGAGNKLLFTNINAFIAPGQPPFCIDTVLSRVGVKTDSPQAELDVSGSAIFSDSRTTGDPIVNIIGYSPSSVVPGVTVQNGSGQVSLFGSLGQGNYNPIVQGYDSAIIFKSTMNNGNLVIAQHSDTPSGLRINSSGYTINYGSFSVFSTATNLANIGGITFIPDADGSGNELRYGGGGTNANVFRFVGPGDVEHMRIQGLGAGDTRVGINNTNPTRTLDVLGGIKVVSSILIKAGTDDTLGSQMCRFERATSSNFTTIDYMVGQDNTLINGPWVDTRYVYDNLATATSVWSIGLSTNNGLPHGAATGDVLFYNNVFSEKNIRVNVTTADARSGLLVNSGGDVPASVCTIIGAYSEGSFSSANVGSIQVMGGGGVSPYTLALNPRGGDVSIGSTISNCDILSNILYVSGNIGVGTTSPSYKLHVIGDIYASGNITAGSDRRFKDSITTISNALSTVKEIRGATYTMIANNTKQVGFIAQELESVLPEVVFTDTSPDQYKSIAYGNIVAVLVEAIKELSDKVDKLESRLNI